jgi:hypothetical protein
MIKEMGTSPSSNHDDLARRIQDLDQSVAGGTPDVRLLRASERPRPSTQPQETIGEICGRYPKFHNNRAAYQVAQERARIYECAVLETQLVTWQQYSPEDPRAIARIDAAKKTAHDLLEKHYPRIPEACATALLGIGYIVTSANPNAQESCTRAENSIEQAR